MNAKMPPPSIRRFCRSFIYAGQGLSYLFRTQRNAQVHLLTGALVLAMAGWLHIRSRAEWAILILTIASVLILEGINTSLEAAIDLFSTARHPLAKVAKDLAAGMVLIAAVAAVIVGLLILGPPLWVKLFSPAG